MKNILLHPMYFGSIAQYVAIANAESIVFEDHDNYQKQTYRNRTYIYGANGRLTLSIPVLHSKDNERQLYRDIKIENSFKWQLLHWRSLESAYRTSPFFEFYEEEFAHLFETPKKYLLDFNYECMQIVWDCLQLDLPYSKSKEYFKTPENIDDQRRLINFKKENTSGFEAYIQVFKDKYGFKPNLSILDLIFNEGTNALTYLESQSIIVP